LITRLAAFIEGQGYQPLTLSRQPVCGGETIIEALERILPESNLIIALFTPDDEGRLRGLKSSSSLASARMS
jgi:hypothetical protein